jgi:G:T-mismatch repair DNA endonuclease (very short patch repair protein)
MDISKLNKMQLTGSYFEKHFPVEYDKINKLEPVKFQEKLYWYTHNLSSVPRCRCGARLKFLCYSKGYQQYCSRKCLNSDPAKIARTKNTCQKRYGGDCPSSSEDIKNKIKATNRSKYGTEWSAGSRQIQDKIRSTVRSKYGVSCAGSIPGRTDKQSITCEKNYGGVGFASEELNTKARATKESLYGDPDYANHEQMKSTCIKRYGGVGNGSIFLKEQYKKIVRNKYIQKYDFLIGYADNGDWICECPHPGCVKCSERSYIISCKHYRGRIKSNTEPCTRLLPVKHTHSAGTTIEIFMRNVLDNLGVEYKTNKGIFDGLQADIWIPAKNVAIELNGTYYHSTLLKEPQYHVNKFKIAQNKGIKLLTFWSDQIYNHPEIVESMVKTKLGYCNTVIYARKCDIASVNSQEAAEFLESNHIQGASPSQIRYGLYYKGQLVSLMTFTKQPGCQGVKGDDSWVLNRFCNIINTRVIGGASRLLHNFIKNVDPEIVVSFSHNDISDGHLYEVLGFESDHKVNTSYYYVKGNKRYHRSTFTKNGIVKRGWRDKNDNSWTEAEVMREQKFLCIYDSGTQKWIYKKSSA